MSKRLVESILSGNMLEANDVFEAKLAEIRERKMYEMKRMYQSEAFGGLSKDEIQARKDAGFVKASAPKEKGGLGLSPYDQRKESGKLKKLHQVQSTVGSVKSKKKKKPVSGAPSISMKGERRIGEQALDEAGLGDAARKAHALKQDPQKAAQFRAAMKLRHLGLVPKLNTPSQPKAKEKGSIGQWLSKKGERVSDAMDKYAADRPPGHTAIRAGAAIGRGVKNVASELSSIGFSNLE